MARERLLFLEARVELNALGYAVREYQLPEDDLLWIYAGSAAKWEKGDPGEIVKAPNGVELIATKEHPWKEASGITN